MNRRCAVLTALILTVYLHAAEPAGESRPEQLIEDFEGNDYGKWTVTGNAFGPGPAAGTLPGQMSVTGYHGNKLVNSFHGGDDSRGTLTSPPFTVSRRHLRFLIGGGGYANETCVNLLVDGAVVESATGPNTKPGGSESLEPMSFDLGRHQGKQAVIQIVDKRKGGWGHINADHFVLTDTPARSVSNAAREVTITKRYLLFPVRPGAKSIKMTVQAEGQSPRSFDIEFDDQSPSIWFPFDTSLIQGKKTSITARLVGGDEALQKIRASDSVEGTYPPYQEPDRPGFHFTAQRGWLNDPNGLVYFKGTWHLFFQHNPFGWNWGNMHWGHATSNDLFHWREQPIAIPPKNYGDWAFSGSAVVDEKNTSGFGTGTDPVLVAAYTSTGRGECITYSRDGGQTWTEYDKNPVVRHRGRDPRLVWHAGSKRWVMAVYDEEENQRRIAFYTSPNLKEWTFRSFAEGNFYECPDLFPISQVTAKRTPVPEAEKTWVLYGADAKYVVGEFDGSVFRATTEKQTLWRGNFYAAQTYSNAPDNRHVQIGWANGVIFPGAPFNQQMSVPVDLTLRDTPDGKRLFAEPVPELTKLREDKRTIGQRTISPGENPLDGWGPRQADIEAVITNQSATRWLFDLRGLIVSYESATRKLKVGTHEVVLPGNDQRVELRILVDRGSVEVFAQQGALAFSVAHRPKSPSESFRFQCEGGQVKWESGECYKLASAWLDTQTKDGNSASE